MISQKSKNRFWQWRCFHYVRTKKIPIWVATLSIFLVGLGSLLIIFSLAKETAYYNKVNAITEQRLSLKSTESPLLSSRSFYMGFQPMPYDLTTDGILDTYETIAQHADLITMHFEEGIPWSEASDNIPYDKEILNDINFRVSQLRPNQKVFLELTPLSFTRNHLAGCWNEESERCTLWQNKSFADPTVKAAYLNYARYMISRFHPDYLAYGVEVNLFSVSNPEEFIAYESFCQSVYTVLKREYPNLPIFLTFVIPNENEKNTEVFRRQTAGITSLMPYSDYMAVSTYPFTFLPSFESIPTNWLSKMIAFDPAKPFAIAETAYPAENVNINDEKLGFVVNFTGQPASQAAYLKFVLTEANKLNAKFITWYTIRDYDRTWEKLRKQNFPAIGKTWKDTGLLSDDTEPMESPKNNRPAMVIWDQVLAQKISPNLIDCAKTFGNNYQCVKQTETRGKDYDSKTYNTYPGCDTGGQGYGVCTPFVKPSITLSNWQNTKVSLNTPFTISWQTANTSASSTVTIRLIKSPEAAQKQSIILGLVSGSLNNTQISFDKKTGFFEPYKKYQLELELRDLTTGLTAVTQTTKPINITN
ncbi:MAG: hypothetical protein WCK11_00940 [Candidatus Falkowbacteria bacterium]